MTVGELQAELAKLDPAVELMVAASGMFATLGGVIATPTSKIAVLKGLGKIMAGRNFTIPEQGALFRMAEGGLDDEQIADVMSRTPDSVKRKRKELGVVMPS